MNKAELAEKIAERVGITKPQAEEALNTLTQITTETIKAGGEVTLTGFGTFSARARKGREGINPRNPQEKIAIPSVVVAKFKAGKNLKDALKGKEDKRTEPASTVEAGQ
ncbi:MAG: HU family DNA-binding protein [Patescibacteria group bacterium]